jgi:PIN domain nuclease of toxin-antitoxin system
MRCLLDTHSLIWFIGGDEELSPRARGLIDDEANEVFLSAASLWEMAIKYSLGKLDLKAPFEELFPRQLDTNSIEVLGITVDHLKALCLLPFHHKDPFDRLIAAQALTEELTLISADGVMSRYGVARE